VAKILFIDDVPEIRKLYSTILSKKGHTVVVAASVMQAMMSIRRTEFDFVFVDIKIPDFDGFNFLKEARLEEEHPNTKVVVLSNSESVKDYDRAKRMGVEEYLVKIDYSPYGVAQLIEQHKL
jgi:CheY-like chemotaxis protein